jgi:hypothetical protein
VVGIGDQIEFDAPTAAIQRLGNSRGKKTSGMQATQYTLEILSKRRVKMAVRVHRVKIHKVPAQTDDYAFEFVRR